jgi:transcription antitermination factor NusG
MAARVAITDSCLFRSHLQRLQKVDVTKMGEACLNDSTDSWIFDSALHSAADHSRPFAWYALKVRTGGELSAVTVLQSRGFDPYCPTHTERRRYSDRMKAVEAPLFPGYVFCEFDVQKKLPIVSSPGVEYIVGAGGAPIPIPEEELRSIRRVVDAGACAAPYFARGQRVRVTRGPLEGIEGILVRDPNGDRLVVSIELLNQSASLHIDRDEVDPVGHD